MIDAVDFLHADKHESLLQLDTQFFWWVWSSITEVPKKASLQCLYNIPKKIGDEVDFFYVDKHQSFLIIDFNTSKCQSFQMWQAWSWKREGHGGGNDQAFSKYSK